MTHTEWIQRIAFLAAMWLVALWPLIFSVVLASRGDRTVPRRGAFILYSTATSYGAAMFAAFAIWFPIELLAEVMPQWKQDGPASFGLVSGPFGFASGIAKWVPFVVLVLFTVFNTRWLWRRWPAIARAVWP